MKNITRELKDKIIMQYYGQRVIYFKYADGPHYIKRITPAIIQSKERNEYCLWLKPISAITDEHAEELGTIFKLSPPFTFHRDTSSIIIKSELGQVLISFDFEVNTPPSGYEFYNPTITLKAYQYFQSKGYAIPYLDYTINDLIELGVYKLI